MKLLVLSASDLRTALPMRDAIQTMKSAFAALSTGQAHAPQRSVVPAEPADGVTLLMGAYLPKAGISAKVVSVFQRNRQLGKNVVNALVVVMDPNTGEPVALCDGTYLTALRTGAASGAATDLLAHANARVGAVIGCGAQARTQVLAIDCVRELESIGVYDMRADAARRFIDEMQPRVQARLDAVTTSADAVRGADVICTATNSKTPVFDGALLAPGAHVNGIGSFTPEMQEVDATAVRRARIFVDSLEAAAAEAGDLVIAERQGCTRRADWIELGLVAAGKAPGRQGPDDITFFKSVGHAVQDVAAAARALQTARVKGLGKELEF